MGASNKTAAATSAAGLPIMELAGSNAGQKVAFTTHAESAAIVANMVRVCSDADCFVEFGSAPVAAADTSTYLPAKTPEYFAIESGWKVSVVQVSAGGNLYVTPVASA